MSVSAAQAPGKQDLAQLLIAAQQLQPRGLESEADWMSSVGAADVKHQLKQAEAKGRDAVRKASPWIVRSARLGLVAKGFVYVVVGWLALRVGLIGGGGKLVDQQGALHDIFHRTFGGILLGILAVGLFGFMTWMVLRALLNPDRLPHEARGYSMRFGWLFTGVVYGGLGYAAVRLLVGTRGEHADLRDWTHTLMGQPFGKWLVVCVGIGFLIFGVCRVFMAKRLASTEELMLDHVATRARGVIVALVWFGEIARAVVFTIIGVFAISAGWHANPDEAKGLPEALAYLAGKPYGPYMLGAVAAGLMAYGLYQFVEAKYQRIRVG